MGCQKLIYKPELHIYSSKKLRGRNGMYIYKSRYTFNGKEVDNDIYGEGNAYDFGARIYDGRLGRWMSRDPLEKEFSYVSPYIFSLNSPLVLNDPDGKKPRITITDEVVGYAYQRVAWVNPVTKEHGATNIAIMVPVYKVIIENVDELTKKATPSDETFGVVRDAWVIETTDKKPPNTDDLSKITIKNWGSEPSSDIKFDLTPIQDYPELSKLPAYMISSGGKTSYTQNSNAYMKTQANTLLHVAGVYYNPGDKQARPVYSLGCYGIVDPKQSKKPIQQLIDSKIDLSNKTMKDFEVAVLKVQNISKDKKITMNVTARKAFERSAPLITKNPVNYTPK